jgi:hypothetical protein
MFLKLEFAIQVLRQQARDLQKKVDEWNTGPFKTSSLAISEPKEFSEAWETLDLFPPNVTIALRMLRTVLVIYKTELARFDPETPFPTRPHTQGKRDTNSTLVASDHTKMLIDQTTNIITLLWIEIHRLSDNLQHAD